jgi:peptidyl-prolyl cis-trans isomerase B (cyclophilin B)
MAVVQMSTSMGDVVIELFPDKAPKSVENFLRYVNEGHYQGTLIHRVVSNFVIQGGGFSKGMIQKPSYPPIPNEAKNGLRNTRGTIALARTKNPHSATAQFFINLNDNDFLNYTSSTPEGWGYCVFGRVIEGMDVVETISGVPTASRYGFASVPSSDILIESVTPLKQQRQRGL